MIRAAFFVALFLLQPTAVPATRIVSTAELAHKRAYELLSRVWSSRTTEQALSELKVLEKAPDSKLLGPRGSARNAEYKRLEAALKLGRSWLLAGKCKAAAPPIETFSTCLKRAILGNHFIF